jgi:hypothetical protein
MPTPFTAPGAGRASALAGPPAAEPTVRLNWWADGQINAQPDRCPQRIELRSWLLGQAAWGVLSAADYAEKLTYLSPSMRRAQVMARRSRQCEAPQRRGGATSTWS